jgi:hypothetical protein
MACSYSWATDGAEEQRLLNNSRMLWIRFKERTRCDVVSAPCCLACRIRERRTYLCAPGVLVDALPQGPGRWRSARDWVAWKQVCSLSCWPPRLSGC